MGFALFGCCAGMALGWRHVDVVPVLEHEYDFCRPHSGCVDLDNVGLSIVGSDGSCILFPVRGIGKAR